MSVMLWECSWLSKIYSDSKSRVSEVKNSRNIFTLFLPQSKGPFSKTVRESCPQIRVRLQNYQYQTPRSIGFDGEVFYNVWQGMEPPQLVVLCSSQNLNKAIALDLNTIALGLGHKTSVEDIFSQRHSYLSELNRNTALKELSKEFWFIFSELEK